MLVFVFVSLCHCSLLWWLAGGGQTVAHIRYVKKVHRQKWHSGSESNKQVVSTTMQTSLFTYQHLYSYELKSFLQRLYTESQNPPPKYFYQNPTQTNQNTYSGLLTYDPLILQRGWTVHSSSPPLSQHHYQI